MAAAIKVTVLTCYAKSHTCAHKLTRVTVTVAIYQNSDDDNSSFTRSGTYFREKYSVNGDIIFSKI